MPEVAAVSISTARQSRSVIGARISPNSQTRNTPIAAAGVGP